MTGKRQKEQRRLEPGHSTVRRVVPAPFPPGSLPVQRNGLSSTKGQGSQTTPRRGETSPSGLRGLYIISVAARLLEMHPQTLRKYERVGLVSPSRTMGMLRLYSQQDITRLRLIKHLVDDLRMNLAGVEFVLSLLGQLREARERIVAMEEEQGVESVVGEELEKLLKMLTIAFDELEEE